MAWRQTYDGLGSFEVQCHGRNQGLYNGNIMHALAISTGANF